MSQATNTGAGVVKWFDAIRGYGFIKVDGTKQDVFVHISAVEDADQNLQSGERVEFVITEGKKGKQAQQVRRVSSQEAL